MPPAVEYVDRSQFDLVNRVERFADEPGVASQALANQRNDCLIWLGYCGSKARNRFYQVSTSVTKVARTSTGEDSTLEEYVYDAWGRLAREIRQLSNAPAKSSAVPSEM